MKVANRFVSGMAVAAAFSLCAQTPDQVIVAAMSLSTAPNYAWTRHVVRNGRTTDIRGQTNTGNGYSLLTFIGFDTAPSPTRSGANAPSATSAPGTNAVFLGNDKYVVETPQGWAQPIDASTAGDGARQDNRGGGAAGGRAGGGNRGMRGGGARSGGGGGSRSRAGGAAPTPGASARAKLPTSINLPHEELAIIAANYVEIRYENGAYTGKLTQTGADLLLVPPGSAWRAPEGANGTFRIWTKDDAVTKYELKLAAESAPGGRAGGERLAETVTVEVSNVGTTRFEVPAAAKAKLR